MRLKRVGVGYSFLDEKGFLMLKKGVGVRMGKRKPKEVIKGLRETRER